MNQRTCVILVPFATYIAPQCESALDELERRGYPVHRVRGFASIDLGRNQMATDALGAGFQETLWIDADIGFHPDAVDQLRSQNLPVVCGIYARRNAPALAIKPLPSASSIAVGKGAGLCEIMYGATGFMHVRREVYETMQSKLQLPSCNAGFARPWCPISNRWWSSMTEVTFTSLKTFLFASGPRQCGYKIMADASIRLWHLGEHAYGWEDAGLDWPRYESFRFEVEAAPPQR